MNEEKTSIEKLANMNLEGLLLPEPAPVSYWWLWGLIGFISLIATIVWKKRYDSPRAAALRSLKKLQKKIKKQCKKDLSINSRDSQKIKQQIARSLRQGFSKTRLDKVMSENVQWRDYLSMLETALYANKLSQPQDLLSLIKSAESWLKVSER